MSKEQDVLKAFDDWWAAAKGTPAFASVQDPVEALDMLRDMKTMPANDELRQWADIFEVTGRPGWFRAICEIVSHK